MWSHVAGLMFLDSERDIVPLSSRVEGVSEECQMQDTGGGI
jgi:hypothetical protein